MTRDEFIQHLNKEVWVSGWGMTALSAEEAHKRPEERQEQELRQLLAEARSLLLQAIGQPGGEGLFTLGRRDDEYRAGVIGERIGALVVRIDRLPQDGT